MTTMTAPSRAAIYLRQSRDAAGDGLAVERQRQDCVRLAAERGWTVIPGGVLTDNDMSASTGRRRPGYERLLELVDARAVDVVVVWHIDRLTRRLADLVNVIDRTEKASVRIATVAGDLDLSTDAGRLVARILGSVAQGEVERKSTRQKRAGRQAAEAGRPPARRAFGFTNGTQHPAEAEAVRELYRLVLAGMTMVAATRWLNERGFTTTTGKRWDRSSARTMLLNPRNAGLRAYHGEVIGPGTWEPIVDEATWRAARELIADPARYRGQGALRWLGGGLFRCHCGARVRVNYSQHGKRVYQCQARSHLSRSAEPVDALIEQTMVDLLRVPGLLAARVAADEQDGVPELRDRAAALRHRLDQVTTDYADGLLTGRQLKAATEKITDELAEVEGQLAEAGRGSRLGSLLAAADPGQAWLDESDLGVRRSALDALVTVTLLPSKPGRAPFDPATVRIERHARG
jgi:DNA invertase Pin-like site-specific DNA recombinase